MLKSVFKKYGFIVLAVVLGILFLTGCKESGKPEEILNNNNIVLVKGIKDKDLELSLEDIQGLEQVERDVVAITSSGKETPQRVEGGLFEELLNRYGISQKDLLSIRFTAIDGYSIEIPKEILDNREIVLVTSIDGEPLGEESLPARIVIPEERAMYWVRNIAEVEIVFGEAIVNESIDKIVVLETAISDIEKQDYEYYGSVDKAIKNKDLLNKLNLEGKENVFIRASDGLEKNEQGERFKESFIRVTGKESPMFLAPELPQGMHVKEILWFSTDKTAVVSMERAMEVYPKINYNDIEGISVKTIIDEIGLKDGELYVFIAEDDYTVKLSKENMEKGMVYIEENEDIYIVFEGLEKNTMVKKLLSIEVK